MAHYLVTGASGFLGTNLTSRLVEAGHEVSCLVRATSDVATLHKLGVRLLCGDVTAADSLPPALRGVDTVFHLAGRTRAFSAKEFAEVNVTGCENVAMACADQESPPTLVLVSSLAAGGPSEPGHARTETQMEAPVCNYGHTKLHGEKRVTRFAGVVPITVVRPPIVFGPAGRDGLVLFQAIYRTGWHLVPRRRELPLSLVYVDDLVEALVLLAESGERLKFSGQRSPAGGHQQQHGHGIYYIADPRTTTYAEMGRLVAQALDRRVRVLKVRSGWAYIPAIWGEVWGRLTGRPSLVSFEKLREAAAPGWVCSAEKLYRQFGFQPPAPLELRFRQTAQWYRAAAWL